MKTIPMFFLLMCSVLFCFGQDTITYKSVKLGHTWWTTTDLVVDGKSELTFFQIPHNMLSNPEGWHVPDGRDFLKLKKVAKANGWQMSDFLVGGKSGLQLEEESYWTSQCAGNTILTTADGHTIETFIEFYTAYIDKNEIHHGYRERATLKLRVRLIKDKP